MAVPPAAALMRTKNVATMSAVAPSDAVLVRPTDVTCYPVEKLKEFAKVPKSADLPPGVYKNNLEWHLSEADFSTAFGMVRVRFDALPGWKQSNSRKLAGLF